METLDRLRRVLQELHVNVPSELISIADQALNLIELAQQEHARKVKSMLDTFDGTHMKGE